MTGLPFYWEWRSQIMHLGRKIPAAIAFVSLRGLAIADYALAGGRIGTLHISPMIKV
ncbi:hypothetical protein [Laspinema olomoucense]|uniref:Uncharacterized protein n=1 Tax=Laspinema olomoucense D3b TaxID=2953688 RepID=A0ABT2NFS4_9CYAN|nr:MULTISPECIES: hypothetical protein [unclassified Laspinema]MCT7973617.1 hypothetical protein [Laspinema sp. D3d]MCT7981346.1 hypothetical protein [Laspinema sp. D3b]MCT7989336.1 hypothetical protein [Laspinema sp. D3a]MCT7996113.1 hypothetical protein [Laspinema sp. D3c]